MRIILHRWRKGAEGTGFCPCAEETWCKATKCVQMSLCKVIFWHQHNSLIRFPPQSQGSAGSFHSQSSFSCQGSLPFSLPFLHFLEFCIHCDPSLWSHWIGVLYVPSAAIINELEICLILKRGHLDSFSSKSCGLCFHYSFRFSLWISAQLFTKLVLNN